MAEIIGAEIIVALGGTAAGAGAALGVSAAVASELVGTLVLTAASVAYSAYEANKARKELSRSLGDQGRQVMSQDPVGPRRTIYGEIVTTGTVFFIGAAGDTNEYMHYLVAIAGHEVAEMSGAFINGNEIPLDGSNNGTGKYANGKFQIRYHRGDPGQGASGEMMLAFPDLWTSAHVGVGVAYFHVILRYDTELYTGGDSFAVRVKGKKVYDPRDPDQDPDDPTTWKYSNNAALCIADFMNSNVP